MKKILILVLISSVLAIAKADSVRLKNLEASELLTALSQVGPGLSAQNTTRVARNINTLRIIVDTWSKGDEAARTRLKISAATKIDSPEGAAYLAEQKKNNLDEVTADLQLVKISDEEISAAKISPVVLSTLLRYLETPAPQSPPQK